ncbi:GTP cyclohydrolase IIa [Psychrobacillus antarcticus]|uniref:GTP cyclohydrolase IIa n=1 Tax=Psychrobacillus antarcticus TaxID=2879115 RepID=UPI002407D63E|nr:GTP cyclohydrolase IIa [Psychrobacillus antarcticus]
MISKHAFNDTSDIKIGIIGPKDLVTKTKETLMAFPNFNPVFRIVEQDSQIYDITKELLNDVEVLMFTEFHAYNIAKQLFDFKIPVHHMPLMGTGLYRSLFLIKIANHLTSLSIDTFDKKYIEQILLELEEENYDLYVHKSNTTSLEINGIVNFHINNYRTNNSIALTGIKDVAMQLDNLKIPYQWVTPTQQDMIVSFERALLATDTRRNKESQIVFGLINIDNFKNVTAKYSSEHDVQLLKLKLQQMLLEYIKMLDGHLINLGGDEYSFITTRGIFERETRGYKFIPLLQDVKNELGVTISLGVGFGRTAAESGNHARLALRQSLDLGGNVCYIVREDQSVLGPVDITTYKQYERYNLAITDPQLLDKAEKAGMSASYMTKLMARVSRHKKIEYTAQELASTLNVTIRSANRILLKWTDAELVDIVGEEKVTHKGRPRRIYRLSFIDEE